MQISSEDNRPPVRGVIDCVAAGCQLAARHPWLVAIPAGLDMALWLGPRLSVNRLLLDVLAQVQPTPEMGADYLATIEAARQTLTDASGQVNLAGLISANFLGVPSLLGTGALGRDLLPTPPMVLEITSWAAAGLGALAFTLLSVWIGATFLTGLAQAVRASETGLRPYLVQMWLSGWRLTVWLALQAAVALFVGVPVILLVTLVLVFNTGIASFIMGLAWLVVMWVAIYLFFVVPSITAGPTGAFRSMWNSLNVVRWNLAPSLGLIVLVSLLQRGLPLAWEALAIDPMIVPLCIIGNAYIGAGLMAACMIFYRERFAAWQTWLNVHRATTPARAIGPSKSQERGPR